MVKTVQVEQLLSFLDNQPQPHIVMDQHYTIVGANSAYRNQYGGLDQIEGRHCYEVSHHFARPCDEMGETCPLKHSKSSGKPQRVLHVHQTPHGEEHVDVALTPIYNNDGEITYFVEMIQTIKEASLNPKSRGLVGRSAAFNNMIGLVERVAPSEATVLLLGESGTGKELVAQAIHQVSKRANKPFVVVDCSGLTETLFESELFGHEKGAFTGAMQRKYGLVESASGGTLFLDEVGDIPLNIQVKLLRLIETGTYRRVGGVDTLRADFRLISATHRDLKIMVNEERFRKDLYYRISTFPIHLPALSERRADISLLANTLLDRISSERKLSLHPDALIKLEQCHFPGNIRELRNILERASLMTDSDMIMPEHLIFEFVTSAPTELGATETILPLTQIERRYLEWASSNHSGDRATLAKMLGVSERTLYRKLQQS